MSKRRLEYYVIRSGKEAQDHPPDGLSCHVHFSIGRYDGDVNEEQPKQILQLVVG
jgi:hypothetical protein